MQETWVWSLDWEDLLKKGMAAHSRILCLEKFHGQRSLVVVQSVSPVQLFVTPRTTACPASLSFTISWSLLRLMSFESVMPSNHLILLSLSPPAFNPSNECSGLISLRIDWFDLLAVQGTLKSLLQCHGLKASILQCSVFLMVQLPSIHDYWKNHSFDYTDLCQQSAVSVS